MARKFVICMQQKWENSGRSNLDSSNSKVSKLWHLFSCVCVHFFMKILPDRLKGTSLARYRPLKVVVVHFCSKTIGPSVVKVVAFTNQNFIYEYFWVGHVTTTKLVTRIFFCINTERSATPTSSSCSFQSQVLKAGRHQKRLIINSCESALEAQRPRFWHILA